MLTRMLSHTLALERRNAYGIAESPDRQIAVFVKIYPTLRKDPRRESENAGKQHRNGTLERRNAYGIAESPDRQIAVFA